MAGVVASGTTSAASLPSSPSGQPSQAWAADSTKVSQSRSIRLSSACVPEPLHRIPAAQRATEQDQAADPLGMARRPGDRVGHRMEEAEQHDLARARRLDHCVQIADVRLEREVRHVALRAARPAPVVLDEADAATQVREQATQEGDPPLALDVRERDAGQVDQRRAVADRGPGDARPIGGRGGGECGVHTASVA